MADNLEQLQQDVETFIDPNGAPQSIKAANHQNLLKQVLSNTGKYTGSSYVAQKEIVGELSNGQFSFEGNELNPANSVTFAFAKLSADNLDFINVLQNLTKGSVISFKDYAGKKADFKLVSYTFNETRNAYLVTVDSFDGNPAYTYQNDEIQICIFSFIVKASNFQVLNGAEFRVHKLTGNSNFNTVELNDVVTNGYFQDDNALIQYAVYKNTLGDNDINNFGTLANNYNDGNYSMVKPVKFS